MPVPTIRPVPYRPLGKRMPPLDGPGTEQAMLIAISPREFQRECLRCWLEKFCPDFVFESVASSAELDHPGTLANAQAAIIDACSTVLELAWLEGEIASLRAARPNLPILAIVEATAIPSLEAIIASLHIQGYIPTSSRAPVAAAVLRLIIAGGTYFPQDWDRAPRPKMIVAEPDVAPPATVPPGPLTAREWAVLNLLERGMPNKIIAHQLSMSLSTAKAHVHNIIRKLNVQNRTEAALFAGRVRSREIEAPQHRAEAPDTGLPLPPCTAPPLNGFGAMAGKDLEGG